MCCPVLFTLCCVHENDVTGHLSSWYRHKVSGPGLWPHLKGFPSPCSGQPLQWEGHGESRKASQCPTIALSTCSASSATAALTGKTTPSASGLPLSPPSYPMLPQTAFKTVSCLEPLAPALSSVLHICLQTSPHDFSADCTPLHPGGATCQGSSKVSFTPRGPLFSVYCLLLSLLSLRNFSEPAPAP